MKVQKIEFINMGLVSGSFELGGNSVIVAAANGSGKTTFCDALFRVCKDSMPADIVSKGQQQASAKFTMTDGTVIDWSKAQDAEKPTITLIEPTGKAIKNPAKKVLREFVGESFDINADFINAQPKARKAFIAQLAGLNLDQFDAAIKEVEEERTYINRQTKEAAARTVGADPMLAQEELRDVSALRAKEIELVKKQAQGVAAKDKLAAYEKRNTAIDARFKELQEEFDALKAEKGELLSSIQKGKAFIAGIEDVSTEIEQAQQEIAAAENRNKAIEAAKAKQQEVEAYKALQAKAEAAEASVQAARAAKMDAVAQAEFPADLTIDTDGELKFKDKQGNLILVESANEAQKTIIGIMAGLGKLGKVKALSIDMSHLDKTNRQRVFDWATENGLQVFAEKVSDDQQLMIEIIG